MSQIKTSRNQQKPTQIELFEKIADKYVRARRETLCNRIFHTYWGEKMLDHIPFLPWQTKVLENLCGSTELLEMAIGRFDKLYGADISFEMLRRIPWQARKHYEVLICSDARRLGFRSNCFDVVLCRSGLHHVHKHLDEVLTEIHRVLKPGGYLICSEPADDCFFTHLIRTAMYRASSYFDEGEEQGFQTSDLVCRIQQIGFNICRVEKFGYLAYTLIGNTDVFPMFRWLKNRRVINFLIWIDNQSPHIPIWKSLNLASIISARKVE